MLADQKEPVSPVRYVAGHATVSFDFNLDIFGEAITGHICDRYQTVFVEFGVNRAGRCLDPMSSRGDSAHIFQRFDKADRAVATHAEIADIVEKYHAGRGCRIHGVTQKCADDRIVPSRLADDRGAQFIVIASEDPKPFPDPASSQIWKTANNDPRRFAAGV